MRAPGSGPNLERLEARRPPAPRQGRSGTRVGGATTARAWLGVLGASVLAMACAHASDRDGLGDAETTPANAAGPATSVPPVLAPPVSSEAAERERAARRVVQDARAFLKQGRPEAALRASIRGLAIRPEDAPLWRARARALEALGRHDEAAASRARADALDPPPPPLPSGPRNGHFDDLLLVVQSPEVDLSSVRQRDRARAAPVWQEMLVTRLRERLPGARIVFEADQPLASVPEAQRWLTAQARPRLAALRVGSAFCGDSIKDGRFAVASIHRTLPGPPPEDGPVRWIGRPEVDGDHDDGTHAGAGPGDATCASRALERALEVWLADPFFDGGGAPSGVSASAPIDRELLLLLLPTLAEQIAAEHATARRALFVGDLASARAAYARAAVLDPEDTDIAEHLAEIDRTIELNRELVALEAAHGGTSPGGAEEPDDAQARDPGLLPARLTSAQRAALEGQLETERRRRDDLLATLTALMGDRSQAHVPEAALRSSELVDVDAPGPRRAWAQLEPGPPADGPAALDPARLAVRTLHSPSGALIARYYFDRRDLDAAAPTTRAEAGAAPSPAPILVEEDASGDGRLDRWTAYRGGVRTATWEERSAEGLPDLHVVYADDGQTLVRVEFDDEGAAGDGRPDRIYRYVEGRLAHASIDVDGDGSLDRFDHFDERGRVEIREEDLTGDGRIDVRSTFADGRLLRREIMDPAALEARP